MLTLMLSPEEKQDLQFKLMALLQQSVSSAERIRYCEKMIAAIGKDEFAHLINVGRVYNSDKNLIDASYFTFIAARRSAIDADFMDFLIAQGGNVFSTYRTTDNNGTRRINLLHLCAKHLNAPLYHYLISRGVTPLSVTSTDTHVLEFTFHSPELLPTVMTSLPLFDTEEKCIKYIDDEGNNIFNHLFKHEGTLHAVAYFAKKYPELYLSTPLNEAHFKEIARATLYHPSESSAHRMLFAHPLFKTIYQRSEQTCLKRMLIRDKSQLFSRTLHESFKIPLADLETKHPGMRAVVVRYLEILSEPETLKPLLARLSTALDQALSRAGLAKAFETPSAALTYIAVHQYLYPIPKPEYQKLNKGATLTAVLLNILQTVGMGKKSTKWVGFVPEGAANQHIANGDLFIESQFGIGIFHGKYAHMIQWVILIYAIEAGHFKDLSCQDPKLIIQCLTEIKAENGNYLWTMSIDSLLDKYSLRDPYRLTSLITTGHFGPECRTLELYLRDSFCDSYLQWLNAYNEQCTHKLTPLAFAKLNSVSNIGAFAFTDYLINANYDKQAAKYNNPHRTRMRHLTFFPHDDGTPSMIIEKTPHTFTFPS